jgi:transcriptional regulator with XRE-family HTH domain
MDANGRYSVNIQQLRTEQGLTQQELADRLGVNVRTIQRWESEKEDWEISMMKMMAIQAALSGGYKVGDGS